MNFEEYLKENKTLTYSNVGTSMLPLLRQGKDTFTITRKDAVLAERGEDRLRAGDAVLYKRPPKSYVLHRIIEVRDRDYVILGDNCIAREYGIQDKDILGVMTAFSRNGRVLSVRDKRYQRYVRRRISGYPFRIFIKKLVLKIKRGLKKVIRRG